MLLLHALGCWSSQVTVIVHRHRGWVGLLVTSLLWKLACHLLIPWQLVLREATFRSDVHDIFHHRDLPTTSGSNHVGVSWTILINNSLHSDARCQDSGSKEGPVGLWCHRTWLGLCGKGQRNSLESLRLPDKSWQLLGVSAEWQCHHR